MRKMAVLTILSVVLMQSVANGGAQKIPLMMEASVVVNKDKIALRFSKSLADEIQLSGKFYLWQGSESDLPPSGVIITVRSAPVESAAGNEEVSGIFVEATRESTKDRGFYKTIQEQILIVPEIAPVGDDVRGFLAALDRKLEIPGLSAPPK